MTRISFFVAALLVLFAPPARATGIIALPSLTTPLDLAVFGLANSTINNSNVAIYGNEGIYSNVNKSLTNMAPSEVAGNVYVAGTKAYTGPGTVDGAVIVDPTDLAVMSQNALRTASLAAQEPVTQTINSSITNSTVIYGNGGLNVIDINGDIRNSLTLSGTRNDVFILNVAGTLNINGSATLGMDGGVVADHILYNFTGGSGSISTQVGNAVYGTVLAPNYDYTNGDGVIRGAVIAGGTIKLMSGMQVYSNPFAGMDQFGEATPEPASAVFLLTGIVLIALGRLRRPRSRRTVTEQPSASATTAQD